MELSGISLPILIVGSMAIYAFAPNPNDMLLSLAIGCQVLGWVMVILGIFAAWLGNKAIKLIENLGLGAEQ